LLQNVLWHAVAAARRNVLVCQQVIVSRALLGAALLNLIVLLFFSQLNGCFGATATRVVMLDAFFEAAATIGALALEI
jgi:hypothetical protein